MNGYVSGVALILEKRECKVNDNLKEYYKIIDYDYGFENYFKQGRCFISLFKKPGLHIFNANPNSKIQYADFRGLVTLAKENNFNFDFEKIKKYYSEMVGKYVTFNGQNYDLIHDQQFLACIKQKEKEYSDTVLNNDKDIAKMYSNIKKTIIAQDEQIMAILTTLFKNQKVINSNLDEDMIKKLKENLIVYGPTGTGKTEILTQIAKIYKVPIVIEDSTSLSETGYIGRDIKDMLNDLYLESGRNIELAQKGILVLDEFDKLAEKDGSKDHVSRVGVQRSLLKILDGTSYYLDGVKFNTSNLSIVALGAFSGIANDENYHKLTVPDFVNYGIMRELMGRFSKLVAMHPFSKEDIKQILEKSNYSPLNTYRELFKNMNIEFTYDQDFIDYLAEKAIKLGSGAHSLKTIFDDVISGAMFRIFAGDYSAIHLTSPKYEDDKVYRLTQK